MAEAVAARMNGSPLGLLAAGLLTFGVLFSVYALSLQVAELSTVTLGWIVSLHVGLPHGKWMAIAVIVLQAYLVLAPNGRSP